MRRGWNEESGEGAAGGRIGENRARLGFAMTNGRRGHSRAPFVSIQERLPRWTLSCGVPLSSPGSPHPSSARILRLPRFSDLGPPGRAVFSFCPCDLSPGPPLLPLLLSAFPPPSLCVLNVTYLSLVYI